ncbi:MAG: 4-hydroxythreonine-4-phosphate dehydrogenase PdxA, partial [Mariprofundus sp.]
VKPFLLTLGEPAGIGPDCTLLAFQADPERFRNTIVVAPPHWLSERADILGLNISIHPCEHLDSAVPKHHLGCWNPLSGKTADGPVTVGRPSSSTATAVVGCIESAATACMHGHAAAIITAPIEKAILRDSGFDFPGHTEFLANISGTDRVVMMLASAQLRVALLTTHMAISDVAKALDTDGILHDLNIINDDLKHRFGISQPRIAVCGLNPHPGEQGHFGSEEPTILRPAIEQAIAYGMLVDGPLPADTLFSPQVRSHYDAIVCCYHDQGLIPIKTLSFGEAVNITLGLPFIRTSVDHGTALDRAGTGKVSYSSIMEAIRMARLMAESNHADQ